MARKGGSYTLQDGELVLVARTDADPSELTEPKKKARASKGGRTSKPKSED